MPDIAPELRSSVYSQDRSAGIRCNFVDFAPHWLTAYHLGGLFDAQSLAILTVAQVLHCKKLFMLKFARSR